MDRAREKRRAYISEVYAFGCVKNESNPAMYKDDYLPVKDPRLLQHIS